MKKSFHMTAGLYLGGVETVIINWYRNIPNEFRFDFGVNTLEKAHFAEEIKNKGGKIFLLEKSPSVLGRLAFMYNLYKTLRHNGPYNAFFAHEQYLGSLTCFVAFLAGIKHRVIVSHWVTNYNTTRLKTVIFFILIRLFTTDRLAVSKAAGIAQYGNKISFKIINNGIDISKFSFNTDIRKEIRKKLHIDDNILVIGNISRLSKDKNLDILLEIFAKIHSINSQTVLLQAGSGTLEQELQIKSNELGLTDSIIWLGKCNNVFEMYQAMDCFVFPSENEGLGIVAIEAECAGLPCFLSEGIPSEAHICNTTVISLKESPKKWAEIILNTTKEFIRKDCSAEIKKAGFDIKDTTKQIVKDFLK